MTTSGSGVGGSVGGQPQPSITELEQTAATEVLKTGQGLSITKDTLDQAFYEVGGQLGRYPANPNRPVLPPLVSTRGPAGFESDGGGNWQAAMETLIKGLPLAVQNDYKAQMALPLDQRNLNFVALDNVLTATAMTMAWLEGAVGTSTTEGIAARDIAFNLLLPYIALQALINSGSETIEMATAFLDTAGANYPQGDSLRNAARSINKGLEEMAALLEEVQSSGMTPTEQFAALSEKMSTISAQYDRVYAGDDLSMLSIILASMASLTAALSVSDTASPIMFIAMVACTVGIYTDSSESGVVGPALKAAINAASEGLYEALAPNSNQAILQLMKMVMSTTFLGATALATLINEIGLGIFPQKDEADVAAAREFQTELALSVAVNSGLVSSTISALVETFGLAQVQQQYMKESLKLLALTTMVLATAPGGNPQSAATLFESQQGHISTSLNSLSELVSDGLMNQSFSGNTAASLGISLNQARIALDQGNIEEFITALFAPLTLIGSSDQQFMNDIGTAKSFVLGMAQALTTGMNDQTNTDTRVNFIA